MRRDGLPLSILPDEGVGENYRGGKRLALEVPDLRAAPGHNRRVTVELKRPGTR
jgi:hypothetical protein